MDECRKEEVKRDVSKIGEDILNYIDAIKKDIAVIESDAKVLSYEIEDLAQGNDLLKGLVNEWHLAKETRTACNLRRSELLEVNQTLRDAFADTPVEIASEKNPSGLNSGVASLSGISLKW